MKYFKNLKTSERITTYFSLFNLFSLIVLLISINVIYFALWYNDIEKQSLYDMNINYDSYTEGMSDNNKQAFKNYILQKDTIITPENGDMICSDGVTSKLHDNPEEIKKVMNSLFYKIDGKTYFVFTNTYPEIGEVSVLHDTTTYFNSQILITKISLVIILFFIILNYFIGRFISRNTLAELKEISKKADRFDLDCDFENINITGPENDEIKILASTLNKSFKKIKHQSEVQKQFINDVSHEFKTPLMIMSSKLDLYEKYLEKGKEINPYDFISNMKGNIKKLNKIIETLFFLTRIEEDKSNLEKKEIDLEKFLEKKLNELKDFYTNKNINYILGIEGNINAEKTTFGILLDNLFTNAIKFSNNEVNIKVKFKDNILEISDNGHGIEENKLKYIWKKFTRFDDKIDGFGIGLFLVKRIVKIYSWKIDVQSKVGSGTKFIIKVK